MSRVLGCPEGACAWAPEGALDPDFLVFMWFVEKKPPFFPPIGRNHKELQRKGWV